MKKKNKTRLILLLFLATLGLLFGVWYYNFTITPLDRPFFLSGKKETIVATRVDWMCNCANYVDTTKYSTKSCGVSWMTTTAFLLRPPLRTN